MTLPSTDTRSVLKWPRHAQEPANSAIPSVLSDKPIPPRNTDITGPPDPCHEYDTQAGCLAGFLVELSEQLSAHGFPRREFKLGMGRHAIGKHLGQAPEMVSRLFSRMQQDGLLKVEGRQITICDPESLYALARKQPVRG